jgi:Putative DNA-binding domain
MFPNRLSEVTPADVQGLISEGVTEGTDIEFKRELPSKNPPDAWMSNGRIGDEAKDQLAEEIIAFANTDGGTLVLGIGEDPATKQAVGPVHPLPKCKEAANVLFQSIVSRIEPRLPMFECVGVVTEPDGTSGVVVMRTLPSYLAPHRHSSSRHCFVRRDDATVPMSMVEIQEMTKRTARTMEEIDRAFSEGQSRFISWLSSKFYRTNPETRERHLQPVFVPSTGEHIMSFALRVTAAPMGRSLTGNVRQWLDGLNYPILNGSGRQGQLWNSDLNVTRAWQPRLRAFERILEGSSLNAVDRIGMGGQIDHTVFVTFTDRQSKQMDFGINEFLWSVASVFCFVDAIRCQASRPTQSFGLEIELLMSNSLRIMSHPGLAPPGAQILSPYRLAFPRYEIGSRDEFDALLMTVETDLWNSAGYQPNWELSIDWPDPKV